MGSFLAKTRVISPRLIVFAIFPSKRIIAVITVFMDFAIFLPYLFTTKISSKKSIRLKVLAFSLFTAGLTKKNT